MKHNYPKVTIIGAGNVGATTAYTLMLLGVAREIAIVDSNVQKASGESLDLNHGISFVNPTSIYQADYKDGCQNADVIVITAGAAQKEGETRRYSNQLFQK